jgi:hypothetical protein
MNTVCLSENANKLLKNNLRAKGYELIEIRSTEAVYDAVSSHADIYLCRLPGEIIVAPVQLPLIEEELLRCQVNFLSGVSALGLKYPFNVGFNAAWVGNYLIHNTRHSDSVLLARAENAGLKLLQVKQGYTKCSITVVDENSVITSDQGLETSLRRHGIRVLLISPGHVSLPGFPYGFLGGASGRLKDEIIFNGDLTRHPDFERIVTFIEERGLKPVWFSEYPLEDIGSIIQI